MSDDREYTNVFAAESSFPRECCCLRFASGTSGRGLGLAMVKSQVEAMGGTIAVKSELGQGTTFILEFPTESKSI